MVPRALALLTRVTPPHDDALGLRAGLALVADQFWLLARLPANTPKRPRLVALGGARKRLEARQPEPVPSAPAAPSGLPVGSMAPEFDLPDLSGSSHRLSEFLGRRLLLIFFNPRCGFCTAMAPDLAALAPESRGGRPLPLVVSTGDAEANRQLVETHALRWPVLLQKEMEVASRYQAHGTPMGYLIDEAGAIASELAVGAPALLELGTAQRTNPVARGNKPLSESRLNRSGLKAGTPAPNFRLPRLDGGDLALAAYHGRRVLLVFSNPGCGPCEQLAPHLERLHRERPNLQVLMISRQDQETNPAEVWETGVNLPGGPPAKLGSLPAVRHVFHADGLPYRRAGRASFRRGGGGGARFSVGHPPERLH